MNFVMKDKCIDADTQFLRAVSKAWTKHVYRLRQQAVNIDFLTTTAQKAGGYSGDGKIEYILKESLLRT